jgi:hypothetical protein
MADREDRPPYGDATGHSSLTLCQALIVDA